MKLIKMHGLGNDFIIIDSRNKDLATLTKDKIIEISNRHFGFGCDQFIIIENSYKADAFMRIYNQDGSESGMCGNAARCVASIILEEANQDSITLETIASIIECQKLSDNKIRVNMGTPSFDFKDMGFDSIRKEYDTKDFNFSKLGIPKDKIIYNDKEEVAASFVYIGNPHCVFFLKNCDNLLNLKDTAIQYGFFYENIVKNSINVGFAHVNNSKEILLCVYERGAGLTLACGSGACAAVIAGIRKGILDSKVKVLMPGSISPISFAITSSLTSNDYLEIEWEKDSNNVYMTGGYTYVGAMQLYGGLD